MRRFSSRSAISNAPLAKYEGKMHCSLFTDDTLLHRISSLASVSSHSHSSFFLWCEIQGFVCTGEALQCREGSSSLYVFRITWCDQITRVSLETEGRGRTWALCSLKTCHARTCRPETWSRFYCWLACFSLTFHFFNFNDINMLLMILSCSFFSVKLLWNYVLWIALNK